jgi:hypothetical protein
MRFTTKFQIDRATGCYNWTSTKDKDGYGIFKTWDAGRLVSHRAARWGWETFRGLIPVGLIVLHQCDNPACVNLHHLRLGKHIDNVDDKYDRGRARVRQRVLSDAQHDEIRRAAESGIPRLALSMRYGVTRRQISKIASTHRPHPSR